MDIRIKINHRTVLKKGKKKKKQKREEIKKIRF